MKNEFEYKGIKFYIGGYTPRENEFERGQKYQLFVERFYPGEICEYYPRYISTGAKFETKHAAKNYAIENYFIWF